jgi:hypothetical protein
MIISSRLPDITHPEAQIALVTEWTVDTAERQQAAVDILAAAWAQALWPPSLLSVNLYASTDGKAVLNYAQWANSEASPNQGQSGDEILEQAVPGIKRHQPVDYRLYRSLIRDDPPKTGCIVIVSVEFQGADEQRQRRWVDTVFEALAAETELHPGGISGHFHISADGTRVLNYAEWTTEQAHREALELSGQGTIGRGRKWLDVKNFHGVLTNGFKRYRLVRSLSNDRVGSVAGRE